MLLGKLGVMGRGGGGASPGVIRQGPADFYVRNDGLATAKEDATDGSAAATSLSPAAFNTIMGSAGSAEPNEIYELDGRGGTFTTPFMIERSGSPGRSIVVRGSLTSPPVLSVTGDNAAIEVFNGQNVDIGHFLDVQNTNPVNGRGCIVTSGAAKIRCQNVHVTRNRNAGGTAAGDGFSTFGTSELIGTGLSFKDGLDGATLASNQAFTSHDNSNLDVYGYRAVESNFLAVAVGSSRIRLYAGEASDMAVSMAEINGANPRVLIYSSKLIVNTGNMFTVAGGTANLARILIKDCNTLVSSAGDSIVAGGTINFEGGYFELSAKNRFQLIAADATLRADGTTWRCTDGKDSVITLSGGSAQLSDCLIDLEGYTENTFLWEVNGNASTDARYLRRCAFKNHRQLTNGVVWILSATGPDIEIDEVTAWNAVAGGAFLSTARTDGGASISIRNSGFENLASVSSSEANTTMDYNGFFNAGAAQGGNPETGDPLLEDPANDDFRNGSGSAWTGSGESGGDIGANQNFAA